MVNKKNLYKTKEYWIKEIQNEIYSQVVNYMASYDLNQNELAEKWGVSKRYVSEILNGNCNFSLKKLVELSLALEKAPLIEYVEMNRYYEFMEEMNNLDKQINMLSSEKRT